MERGDERQESLPDEARDKTDELPECLADETVDGAGSSARPTRSYAKVLTTLENLGVAEEKLQSLSYADAVRLLDEMQAEGRLVSFLWVLDLHLAGLINHFSCILRQSHRFLKYRK